MFNITTADKERACRIVCTNLRLGKSQVEACKLARVSYSKIREWRQSDRAFNHDYVKAYNEGMNKCENLQGRGLRVLAY